MERNVELFCEKCPLRTKEEGLFRFETMKRGVITNLTATKAYLIFVLSGNIRISSESVGEYTCGPQKILLLLAHNQYKIEFLDDCEILFLNSISAFQSCDLLRMRQLKTYSPHFTYNFKSLDMNIVMYHFAKSTAKYLCDGMNCIDIHNAKQMELFVIFRFYYTPEIIYPFFFPILDSKVGFESLVKANLPKAKNVEQLATLCGYKQSTFKKLFDRYFNESPYQWMLQQNAKKIRTMLLDETLPIKAIVSEFGFTDQSHFNLFCKKYWGGTAKQIRVRITKE